MSMVSGIQGHLLEVTIVGCSKLKDTEWISRQDPYVCIEYATTKFRTRTCTDGGKHPLFQEKVNIPLIEGLREIVVTVWNSNSITFDDFIGSGRVQLQKVLSQGYDDSSWPLQSKSGRFSGEVKLIMHYPNAHRAHHPAANYTSPAPVYLSAPSAAYNSAPLGYPPMKSVAAPPPVSSYPSAVEAYPPTSAYPPTDHAPYPSTSTYPYPPSSAPYPATSTYPSPMMGYPPNSSPYAPPMMGHPPSSYPPTSYPPQTYPLPPNSQAYPPPGPYLGIYPPPPY